MSITNYTAEELRAKRAESRTDLRRLDATTDADVALLAAADADEAAMFPDWTRARLAVPASK